MMERHDEIVRQFFIFFVEYFDEVYVFRDRRNDDDVGSDQIFFIESFTEELRIKLQRLFDQVSRKRIRLDEIVGLVPVLYDTVVFVHLLQCAHSQVQCLYFVIESVLDFDGFAGVLCDIEEDKIIFFQIVSEEEEGMEWLRENIDVLCLKEISIDGIDDVHGFLIQIYHI